MSAETTKKQAQKKCNPFIFWRSLRYSSVCISVYIGVCIVVCIVVIVVNNYLRWLVSPLQVLYLPAAECAYDSVFGYRFTAMLAEFDFL